MNRLFLNFKHKKDATPDVFAEPVSGLVGFHFAATVAAAFVGAGGRDLSQCSG